MAQVKITVRPNGPCCVEAREGSVELVDANGGVGFAVSGGVGACLVNYHGGIFISFVLRGKDISTDSPPIAKGLARDKGKAPLLAQEHEKCGTPLFRATCT
jgi:hypothetical protein